MKRGDVYLFRLDPTVGSEAEKVRPCVIVSNDASNRQAVMLTVVPVTSNVRRIYKFEVDLAMSLDRPSKAQVEQVRSVSKERVKGEALTCLSTDVMALIDRALKQHLAL